MASPSVQNGAPSTPPPSDPPKASESRTMAAPDAPLTSTDDNGLSKRPRDSRLLHLVLHNLGVQSYQERVPLQLLDFAYRYTSSVLSDALRLSAEGYSGQNTERRRGAGNAGNDDASGITVTALRQAIISRQGYAFESALPKEFLLEQAAERNRIALPKVERSYGVQLPEEKYCLTGVGWSLKDEWGDDEDEEDNLPNTNGTEAGASNESKQTDEAMGGMDDAEEKGEGEDDEGAGRMEDVFGEDADGDAGMDEA